MTRRAGVTARSRERHTGAMAASRGRERAARGVSVTRASCERHMTQTGGARRNQCHGSVMRASHRRHASVTWQRIGGARRHAGVMRASRRRHVAQAGCTRRNQRHGSVMPPSCRRHASVTWPRLAAERGARLVRGGRSLRRRGLEQCRECRQSAARMASWAKSSRDSEARPYSAMKASTMCRASSSRCWTGGLFMKYALGPSSAPARP